MVLHNIRKQLVADRLELIIIILQRVEEALAESIHCVHFF